MSPCFSVRDIRGFNRLWWLWPLSSQLDKLFHNNRLPWWGKQRSEHSTEVLRQRSHLGAYLFVILHSVLFYWVCVISLTASDSSSTGWGRWKNKQTNKIMTSIAFWSRVVAWYRSVLVMTARTMFRFNVLPPPPPTIQLLTTIANQFAVKRAFQPTAERYVSCKSTVARYIIPLQVGGEYLSYSRTIDFKNQTK